MTYFRENIERMVGYVPGEQPSDPAVVKLNTNENPYPPSAAVMEALGQVEADQLRRYPDPTAGLFRQKAGEILGFAPEQIICGNGSDELLTIAIRCFVGPTGRMAYPVPTYSLYHSLAQIEDAGFAEIPFNPDWSLPDELLTAEADLTLVCNPNAPSGTMIEAGELSSLARKIDGVLIVDEAYVDFADFDCLELVEKHKNVLVFRTLSKGYSLAGLRFGYALGNRQLIAGMNKAKDSYNCDVLSVILACEALADQEYMQENADKIRAQRRRLSELFAKADFEVPQSQANFILVTVPRGSPLTAKQLYAALKERRIYVRYFQQHGLADKLRITIGTPEQNDILVQTMQELGISI